jgi:late competence protein required for DNA uptake (superfamily II DNA/RNA helicase)
MMMMMYTRLYWSRNFNYELEKVTLPSLLAVYIDKKSNNNNNNLLFFCMQYFVVAFNYKPLCLGRFF